MARTLVSCDDHMDMAYVPRDLWQSRVPAAVRDGAPKVEETPSGPLWVREGERWGVSGSKRADGRKVVFDMVGLPEEAEPGVFRPASPKYRLEDMERDGIYAQVIYGFLDWSFRDHSLKADCMQAYNTWLWEELCSASPDRLVGLANLPGHDPEGSVGELYRVLDMGLRGAVFDCFKAAKPIFDMAWEPLWSAAAETGAVIRVHIGGDLLGLHQALDEFRRGRRATSEFTRKLRGRDRLVSAGQKLQRARHRQRDAGLVAGGVEMPGQAVRSDEQPVDGGILKTGKFVGRPVGGPVAIHGYLNPFSMCRPEAPMPGSTMKNFPRL